jgi:hypothetical protein
VPGDVTVAFVGVAGLSGFFGAGRTIFPEALAVLTARAFGAFYFALALGVVPLLFRPSVTAELNYARPALVWIVLITVAALAFLGEFDFAQRPGGLIYFGIYLIVGIATVLVLVTSRPVQAPVPRRDLRRGRS